MGDFKGIQNHLDYFESLGVSSLWLSPIHPCGSYHAYDVHDYYSVNPAYGSEADLKALIDAAKAKGIGIYLDYVLNHSGKEHPWFLDAMANPDSKYRDYYFISSDPSADVAAGKFTSITTRNSGEWARTGSAAPASGKYRFTLSDISDTSSVITVTATDEKVTEGTSSWNLYYFSCFSYWMPDLNFGPAAQCENNACFKDLAASADKWINIGVNGFRLDAVKHIYGGIAGWDNASNTTFLESWYNRCNATYTARNGSKGNFFMVGEVFNEYNDSYAPYSTYLNSLPSVFNFSFWWRLSEALNNQKGSDFVSHVLAQEKISDLKGSAYSVASQSADQNSILNVYRTFGKARAKYPALKHGVMSACSGLANNFAAWYMSDSDGNKMLVVHNLSSSEATATLSGELSKIVAQLGSVSVNGNSVTFGGNSSAVFKQY